MRNTICNFDNGYGWRNFIRMFLCFFAVLCVEIVCWYRYDETFDLVFMIVLFFALIIYTCFSWCRNSYVVHDGYLLIKEYNLLWKTLDTQILLDTIVRVDFAWSWYLGGCVVRVCLKDGYSVDLRCTTHARHLISYLNEILSVD